MRHAVVVEVRAGREALAAHLTLVGLLARVDAAVGVEGTRRRESLAAHVTRVGLLSCNDNVHVSDHARNGLSLYGTFWDLG